MGVSARLIKPPTLSAPSSLSSRPLPLPMSGHVARLFGTAVGKPTGPASSLAAPSTATSSEPPSPPTGQSQQDGSSDGSSGGSSSNSSHGDWYQGVRIGGRSWRKWTNRMCLLGLVKLVWEVTCMAVVANESAVVPLEHWDADEWKRAGAPPPSLPASIEITDEERAGMMSELKSSLWFPVAPASYAAVHSELIDLLGDEQQLRSALHASANDRDDSQLVTSEASAPIALNASMWNTCKTIKDASYLTLKAQRLYSQGRLLMDAPCGWKSSNAVRLQVAREIG